MANVIEQLSHLNGTARAAAEAMIPGLQPPPGAMPNFIDPPSRAYWVYVTLPICLAVSTPFVWIRLYTSSFILKNRGWADCNITFKYPHELALTIVSDTSLAAWAFLVGFCAAAYVVVGYGGGVHQWDVPLDRVIEFAKVSPSSRTCTSNESLSKVDQQYRRNDL